MLLKRLHQAERLNRFATYLYVPYQFLQLLGYRLVGKRCNYEWRKYRPEPIGPTNHFQHFIALTFPTGICCTTLAIQVVLAFYLVISYYSPQTPWPLFVLLSQPIPFSLFGAFMLLDFLRLRRLFSKPAPRG